MTATEAVAEIPVLGADLFRLTADPQKEWWHI
jgi:hypothetical protein